MAEGRDEQAARHFIEQMAMLFADWGFPRMSARVLITLMAAEERGLTAGELAERLGASPAAISGAVRYLTHSGLIARESVLGSRSDLYLLPDDAWYTGTATKQSLFAQIIATTEKGIEPLGGPGTKAGARMTEMRDFFVFAQQEMAGVLDRWKALRAER
ncbi:GbsR/MarR family transcriptional regulator [Streptomyces sp. NPDC012403]|uniref:GbsR/MarR family transcriptional regulator n=1 Tax=unclassified Streptomyces TaxID=2593676 RepID=UPI001C230467|nr:MarR family transcriptional regulator [Streptomyces sp. AC558_RSS880]